LGLFIDPFIVNDRLRLIRKDSQEFEIVLKKMADDQYLSQVRETRESGGFGVESRRGMSKSSSGQERFSVLTGKLD
jgi:hypothetical protein